MRDIKRISRITQKFITVWYMFPDMRLVQLLLFVLEYEKEGPQDRFFLEDDLFEKALDAVLQNGGRNV
jgi:division protein CdvB (Snf7/Vps24/ESCRT-III family)